MGTKMEVGLGLALWGLGFAFFNRKSKRKRRTSASDRVLFAKTLAEAEVLKSRVILTKSTCNVATILAPGAVTAWRAAANRLAKEYKQGLFVGLATPEQQLLLGANQWQVGVWLTPDEAAAPAYQSAGTDLDQMALEMENAVLHCK